LATDDAASDAEGNATVTPPANEAPTMAAFILQAKLIPP
jgi:hypothetical protein